MGAGIGQHLHRFRPDIAGVHFQACAQQGLPYAHAHCAETNYADAADLLCHLTCS
jgi:hypothetical protein